MDDIAGLIERLGNTPLRCTCAKAAHEAATQLAALSARVKELEGQLCTVQNAAKTIATCHGTELEHLRQNKTFDHKLRAEHESLLARDAMMTEALEAAESRATRAEARVKELEVERDSSSFVKELIDRARSAEARALRAEQERDEAYERCIRAVRAERLIDPVNRYDQDYNTALDHAEQAIRQIFAGPEKEKKE